MTALTNGMEAWANIRLVEMKEIEKIQGKTLKRIFQLPLSATYIGIIMETGIWPAEQKTQYATMMLYHKVKNSDDKQQKNKNKINLRIPFIRKCKKLQKIYKLILVMSPQPINKNGRQIKAKVIDRIRKRMKEDMQEKTKCRTIQYNK